jgi:hypothetical protein
MKYIPNEIFKIIFRYLDFNVIRICCLVNIDWCLILLPILKTDILTKLFPVNLINTFGGITKFITFKKIRIDYTHLYDISISNIKDNVMIGIDCFSRLFIVFKELNKTQDIYVKNFKLKTNSPSVLILFQRYPNNTYNDIWHLYRIYHNPRNFEYYDNLDISDIYYIIDKISI